MAKYMNHHRDIVSAVMHVHFFYCVRMSAIKREILTMGEIMKCIYRHRHK